MRSPCPFSLRVATVLSVRLPSICLFLYHSWAHPDASVPNWVTELPLDCLWLNTSHHHLASGCHWLPQLYQESKILIFSAHDSPKLIWDFYCSPQLHSSTQDIGYKDPIFLGLKESTHSSFFSYALLRNLCLVMDTVPGHGKYQINIY